MESNAGDVTRLLAAVQEGDATARGELFGLVYDQLRQLGAAYMRRERPGHTLQPTALVHEAYLKLFENQTLNLASRKHLFCAMAQAMRRVLVDHARAQKTGKRGGEGRRLPLEDIFALPGVHPEAALALDQALERLAAMNARQARVVEMHAIVGLSQEEIAELLAVSVKTVKRDWRFAKVWLQRELGREDDPGTIAAGQ